jgi:hypothetical protein
MIDLERKLVEYGERANSLLAPITLDEIRTVATTLPAEPASASDAGVLETVPPAPARHVHRAVWVAVAAALVVLAFFLPTLFNDQQPDVIDNSIPPTPTVPVTSLPLTTVPTSVPAMSEAERVEAWSEDLDFLVASLESVHPDPYWRVGEAGFVAQVAAIRDVLADSTDDEIEFDLMRLMAQIDGHTMVNPDVEPVNLFRSAFQIYKFSDGHYVVQSFFSGGLVGMRLKQIMFRYMDTVSNATAAYVSYDNTQTLRSRVPRYLMMTDLLRDSGVSTRTDTVFTFARGGGSLMVPVGMMRRAGAQWIAPGTGLPTGFGEVSAEGWDRALWWRSLPESGAMFVGFNSGEADTTGVVAELEERLAGEPVGRIVVDLRRNQGGDPAWFASMADFLVDQAADGVTVLCLIGRDTFGEAVGFVADIEDNVVLVGEGTGGSPNFFGDPVVVTLPNSGIEVLISSRYFEYGGSGETRDMIEPDVPVSVSSTDYFEGVDPVLDAALAYQPG